MSKGEKKDIVLGIDLGTSNSAACIYKDDKFMMVPSAEGHSQYGKSFPSFVAFTENGEELVGEPAKKQAINNVEGTISSVKRFIGTDMKFNIRGKEYTPEDISAKILKKIKADSEEFLGEEINNAVITVPANFDNNQRKSTLDAAEKAGLNVINLIHEPTAASVAYGINKSQDKDITILVFDLGGGTLDVTIMEFNDKIFEILSTSGNNYLGGNDMDDALSKYIADEFKEEYGINLLEDKNKEALLKREAEIAKIELSSIQETTINLPYIALDSNNNPISFDKKINRAKLESLVKPIVDKCGDTISEALDGANITPDQVDKVILVGGPTRMPIVKKYVEDYIGISAERGIDPMECVAQGASIYYDIQNPEGSTAIKKVVDGIIEVTSRSLGTVENNVDTVILIEKNTAIPCKYTETFETVSDYQTRVTCQVVEGEAKLAKDNNDLGSFNLEIPARPKGEVKIDITFLIDKNNMLKVTAKNQKTGKSESITIDYAKNKHRNDLAQKIFG